MATDNFPYSDGLLSGNAGWSNVASNIEVVGGQVFAGNSGGGPSCTRNTEVLADNQYAQIVVTSPGSRYMGISVRCASGADTYYAYIGSGNYQEKRLIRHVAGAETILDTSTWLTGTNTLRLEVSGTTLTPLLNGSADVGIPAATDANIASGFAGVAGNGSNNGSTPGDDWESGSLGGGASATRGTPFGHRSTAFNGGRTFHGVIQ
jgi:hypothetical protein